MFHGSLVALITPMRADGSIDEAALAALADWQIAQGTQGLIPAGTTGESATLSHAEHKRVVEIVVEASAKRVPVLAGTGSNATAEAIELTRHALEAGADAALVVTPYYNKPTQEGLFRHYTAIADAASMPVVIYNIPSRSVIDMSVETMARLARHPNIVGVKDSSQNLARPLHTRAACGEAFIQLSGEDHTALAHRASGGHGCIGVTANVAPALCRAMHDAWDAGHLRDAMAIQDQLLALHDALFAETSPAPVKYAASLLGRATPHVRLPLVPASESLRPRVEVAMRAAGLL